MPKKRGNSDAVLATEGKYLLTALQHHGVTPVDMRRTLSDGVRLARVVADLRGGVTTNLSLDTLIVDAIRTGKLTGANINVTSLNFSEVGSHGYKILVDPSKIGLAGHFNFEEARLALSGAGYLPATMWEAADYSQSSWDGKTTVVAIGSVWRSTMGTDWVGFLWSTVTERVLDLFGEDQNDWLRGYRLLAVHKSKSSRP